MNPTAASQPQPTGKIEKAERGTARDALAVPQFRRLFIGSALSNTGSWAQMTILGVLAWKVSESSTYLGLLIFAQLAPMGFLSLLGGSLADTFDLKKLLFGAQLWQMSFTLVLAFMLLDGDISKSALLAVVFTIGIGQGLYAPALTAVVPSVAGHSNLSAAIALNSIQFNAARVVGPAIGGMLLNWFGFAQVFLFNAASFLFLLLAILTISLPPSTSSSVAFKERIFGGFKIAMRAPQVGRPLFAMFVFSMLCLPFIGQLPAIAELNLGIDSQGQDYSYLFAMFGFGGLCGALMVATVFVRASTNFTTRISLTGFAISMACLTFVSELYIAFPVIYVVGLFYFMLPTVLATHWQEHVDSSVRGRVSAIWVLAFGGTLPVSNLIAGRLAEATSISLILIMAVVAAVFMLFIRFPDGEVVGEELLN